MVVDDCFAGDRLKGQRRITTHMYRDSDRSQNSLHEINASEFFPALIFLK